MAAGIMIHCPECDKRYKGKPGLGGRKIRCPFCGGVFVVPREDEEEEVTRAMETPARTLPPAQAPAGEVDEWSEKNPYGVTDIYLGPRCPHCASPMADDKAIICLECGYNTLTRTMGKTEKVLALTFGEHLMHLLPGLLCVFGIVTLMALLLWYCLVFPGTVTGFWRFADHESMRMWATIIVLFAIWTLGFFAFRRIVLNPKPAEKQKD
jgi:hypothetical protein